MKKTSKANSSGAVLCLLTVAALMGVCHFGCEGETPDQKSPRKNIPAVEAVKAELQSITRKIELTGTIEAVRTARIASPAEGPVLYFSLREGDRVKQGATILTIGRQKAAEEQVQAAEKELAQAEEDLRRVKQLVRSGALPAEKMEESELRVSRAQAQLMKAEESMDDYQVRAPWDGIVSRVFVTDGSFVSPRETLLEIFVPNSLVIRFAVPEKELIHVAEGMEISAVLDSYGTHVYPAEITRLYPELDRKTYTRTAEASLADDIEIVPGMFARLSIPVQKIEKALIVPDSAVAVTSEEEKVVFIIREGKAFLRKVTIGVEQENTVQITEGI
ncbi:MAG: efflux RND transporter periplasmic adaptor subunit, partial [Candidatus Aminicenantaceae bacterium]